MLKLDIMQETGMAEMSLILESAVMEKHPGPAIQQGKISILVKGTDIKLGFSIKDRLLEAGDTPEIGSHEVGFLMEEAVVEAKLFFKVTMTEICVFVKTYFFKAGLTFKYGLGKIGSALDICCTKGHFIFKMAIDKGNGTHELASNDRIGRLAKGLKGFFESAIDKGDRNHDLYLVYPLTDHLWW